jgi:hypothetical protein
VIPALEEFKIKIDFRDQIKNSGNNRQTSSVLYQ